MHSFPLKGSETVKSFTDRKLIKLVTYKSDTKEVDSDPSIEINLPCCEEKVE